MCSSCTYVFTYSYVRLFDSAKALAFSNVPTREQVRIWKTNKFFCLIAWGILFAYTSQFTSIGRDRSIFIHWPAFLLFIFMLTKCLLQVKDAIFKTLIRNGMFDNAHIRLSLTRGKKVLSLPLLCVCAKSTHAHTCLVVIFIVWPMKWRSETLIDVN